MLSKYKEDHSNDDVSLYDKLVFEITKNYVLSSKKVPEKCDIDIIASAFCNELRFLDVKYISRLFTIARQKFSANPTITQLMKAYKETLFFELKKEREELIKKRKDRIEALHHKNNDEDKEKAWRETWVESLAKNNYCPHFLIDKYKITDFEVEQKRRQLGIYKQD